MSTFRDASRDDLVVIEALIGRPLAGRCAVVVRRLDGRPVVIENEPHLRDGTPMPTLYWLVDRELNAAVSRLEGDGGVHRFESLVDPAELAAAHEDYARRRDAAIVQRGVAPTGGVGGTRTGIKCLHAHLANFLAGASDPVGALVADAVGLPELRRDDVRDGPVAVIDCGSNSTRLVIVDASMRTLEREMRITRLSAGVDATGQLAPDALARTYAVLSEYRALMDRHGVNAGMVVGTSAVRDAANRDDFVDGARAIAGVDVRVLDGPTEAEFSYAGATTGLAQDGRALMIVDVGGGSTELAVRLDGVMHATSMQIGCVRVTERSLGREVVTHARRIAAEAMIARALDAAIDADPALASVPGGVRLVGLAGTVATLVQLDLGLATYSREAVHHHLVTRDVVQYWRDRLANESPEQRLGHPGMVSGREDVLVAGLMVLDAVMDRVGASDLLSSESDILDGVAAWLLDTRGTPSTWHDGGVRWQR